MIVDKGHARFLGSTDCHPMCLSIEDPDLHSVQALPACAGN